MEAWQRDVLQIIREESYYFHPQFNTKILNEGWASYWHAELFHLYESVLPNEMIEFARLHAGVVNPGGRFSINPYYLGYTVLVDIEKRWDQMHAAGESVLELEVGVDPAVVRGDLDVEGRREAEVLEVVDDPDRADAGLQPRLEQQRVLVVERHREGGAVAAREVGLGRAVGALDQRARGRAAALLGGLGDGESDGAVAELDRRQLHVAVR